MTVFGEYKNAVVGEVFGTSVCLPLDARACHVEMAGPEFWFLSPSQFAVTVQAQAMFHAMGPFHP